jgi:hypothetical protein
VVTARDKGGRPGVWREQSRHTHRWIVGRPLGPLAEGICKGCGARRDFLEGVRRSHVNQAHPLESLGGRWLADGVGAFATPGEGTMTQHYDDDERRAQRIACSHLILGCEAAVSDMLIELGDEGSGSPAMVRAREILAHVLSSWHETLRALTPKDEPVEEPVA